MPTIATLDAGREYSDEEVRALSGDRRPKPVEPYGYNQPATGQGQGLSRRSDFGDKWCPFCQTPLDRSSRQQSCATCKPVRDRTLEEQRGGSPGRPLLATGTQRENHRDIEQLLDSIDEMSRVIGTAYAMRYRNGGLKAEHAEDILVAAKDVMVSSDPLRRRLRRPQAAGGQPGPPGPPAQS